VAIVVVACAGGLLGEFDGAPQTGGLGEPAKDDAAGSLAGHARRELLLVGSHEVFFHHPSDRYTCVVWSGGGHGLRQRRVAWRRIVATPAPGNKPLRR
jgi:hypothetical protein